MSETIDKTILVTGVSGFLGGQVTMDLLDAGYIVRGSIRNIKKSEQIKSNFERLGKDTSKLEFVALDLLQDEGWDEAAQGCHSMIHVASPFITNIPKNKNELIEPAVKGTERAITAALKANLKRIVLTSSTAAITQGHESKTVENYDASIWTNLKSSKVTPYPESKTRAEMKAWELVRKAGREKDLVVINPGFIAGPIHNTDAGTSGAIILRFLHGDMPAIPDMSLIVTDVRDVAAAHINGLTTTEFAGKRIPISSGSLTLKGIADILRSQFPEFANTIPSKLAPNIIVRILALFDKDMRGILCELGIFKTIDNSDAIKLLDRQPTDMTDALRALVQSLIDYDLVSKPR